MIKGKLYTIVLHCIGWLLFFSLPVIFIFSQSPVSSSGFSWGNLYFAFGFVIYITIFYLHTYFLFPQLFFGSKKPLYFLSMVVMLALVFLLRPFDRLASLNRASSGQPANVRDLAPPGDQPPYQINAGGRPHPPPPFDDSNAKPPAFDRPGAAGRTHIDIISIELFIVVVAISIALILEKRWRIAIQEASRAEADKVNAELSFLKAQINPHFLFNTLNNIYSLAVTKNENAADAIMKLSNIMRYVTDDVNEDFVPLEKELDAINDYISLQRLRLGKKANIEFITEGNMDGKAIAPLILMPFVENAFKHGISNSEGSTIIIKLIASEKNIAFYTANKLFATPRNVERTGIGNTNTKKRLASIYPGKHLLETRSQDGLFTVQLVMYI